MPLKVSSMQKAPALFIVSLDGSLNYQTSALLEKKMKSILAASPLMVVFDMTYLEFLSSEGIRVILKAKMALKKNDGELAFMNLQTRVKKVLEIINLIPAIKNFMHVEEVVEYFGAIQKAGNADKT